MNRMKRTYEDLYDLPHHVSKTRPQMPVGERAAQFSPFAALTGYEAAVEETARFTEERISLDEAEKERLNETLAQVRIHLEEQKRSGIRQVSAKQDGAEAKPQDDAEQGAVRVRVTYFQPDERKDGGTYVTAAGEVKKLEEYRNLLILKDGTEIPVREIREIEALFMAQRIDGI